MREEQVKVEKFLLVLKKFGDDKNRSMRIVLEDVFGNTRLNAVCRMEYFLVEVTILIYLLFTLRDSDCIEMAARNFQHGEGTDVCSKEVAVGDCGENVGRMKGDVFRRN